MAGALAGAVSANAGPADLPAGVWTGFYVGVNGGYGWSGTDSTIYAEAVYGLNLPNPTVATSALQSFEKNGGFGGGQIGYNWQGALGLGHNWVLGVEADIQGGDIRGSGSASATAIDIASNTHISSNAYRNSGLDWFGTVRGRAGYAVDNALIYATGGLAYGGVSGKASTTLAQAIPGFFPGASTFAVDTGATHAGYSAGAGLEYAFGPRWSVKAEYQYIDLGSAHGFLGLHHFVVDPANPAVTPEVRARGYFAIEQNFNTVRVGLNYKLEDVAVPLN
jgi:outer membrane immunogenic protein